MFLVRSRRRAGWLLTVALLAAHLLAGAQPAWAGHRKQEPAAAPPQKSYVLPYGAVIMGISLGLILLLRPVKRSDELKRTDKQE